MLTWIRPGHLVCLALGLVLGAAAWSDRSPETPVQTHPAEPAPPVVAMMQSVPAEPSSGIDIVDEPQDARGLLEDVASLNTEDALITGAIEVACDIDEAMGEQLATLREENPAHFERVMRTRGTKLMDMARLRAHDPELYETRLQEMRIEHQVMHTTRQLCAAIEAQQTDEAASIEKELRGLLMQQLAFRIKARGDYINALDEKIAELQQELTAMVENMDHRIDRRIETLKSCNRQGEVPPE